MSSPPSPEPPPEPSPWEPPDGPPLAGPAATEPARRHWSPWAEVRRDWRSLATMVVGLAVIGVPLGALWWAFAPRAGFTITADGPVVIGQPSEELLAADDSIFCLIVAAAGVVAGVVGWLARHRRGLATLLGLAVGMVASAAVAWQIGGLLGPGPSHAALTHVGGRVTTPLNLGAMPALAVGPFFAVLVYVIAALYTRNDGLGRSEPLPPATTPAGSFFSSPSSE